MKENGDDTKKWKDIPCSLIGRIIIVKMFILPEAIYRFSVISVKIQMEFFIVICFYSVTKLCLTLCDSMDYSMSDFPILHYLLEFAQTHVSSINDDI